VILSSKPSLHLRSDKKSRLDGAVLLMATDKRRPQDEQRKLALRVRNLNRKCRWCTLFPGRNKKKTRTARALGMNNGSRLPVPVTAMKEEMYVIHALAALRRLARPGAAWVREKS